MIPEKGKIYFIEYVSPSMKDIDSSYVGWARCTGEADVKDSDGSKLYLFDLLDSNYTSEWAMFTEKDIRRESGDRPAKMSRTIGRRII